MKSMVSSIVVLALIVLFAASTQSEAASCTDGKISCGDWCAKYRPGATDCSCAGKPNGDGSCVPDKCNPTNDSCIRQGQTCSDENRLCVNFCQQNPEHATCLADCAGRQSECLKTGTYVWKNSASKVGLIKK